METRSSLRQRRQHTDRAEGAPLQEREGEESASAVSHKGASLRFSLTNWVALFLSIVLIFMVVRYVHEMLPEPVECGEDAALCVAETKVRKCVGDLEKYGPRPAGGPSCETHSAGYILEFLGSLKSDRLEFERNSVSGCFSIEVFGARTLTSCYYNVTNIVARLYGRSKAEPRDAIMFNCHFDTVAAGPGASDDTVNCCTLLEMLRSFARHSIARDYDFIFLFNGAEETMLQASHGFITQHRWRHDVYAFINVEAAGAGGRELLFQAGPHNPTLIKAYLDSAPRPHANVLAQDVFQSGIIPSDTDFRIFRDFGNLSGLDIAYTANGYVYHTEFDVERLVSPGAIHHTAANILAVTKQIVSQPKHTNTDPSPMVFFDVVGLFSVQYPMWTGTLLHTILLVVILVMTVYVCYTHSVPCVSVAFAALHLLLSLVCALAWIALCAALFTYTGRTMLWYATPLVLVMFYLLPASLVGLLYHVLTTNRQTDRQARMLGSTVVSLVTLGLLLLLATAFQIGAGYFLLFITAFHLLHNIWLLAMVRFKPRYNSLALLGVVVLAFVPLVFCSYFYIELTDAFIPIVGRSGGRRSPEITLGVICGLLAVVFVVYTHSMVHLSHILPLRSLLLSIVTVCAACVVFAAATSYVQPFYYAPEAPRLKRVMFQHASRRVQSFDGAVSYRDTGILISPQDYRGMSDVDVSPYDEIRTDNETKCIETSAYCGMPFYRVMKDSFINSTHWIPVTQQLTIRNHSLRVESAVRKEGEEVSVLFSIEAPSHLTVFMNAPRHTLSSWSLDTEITKKNGDLYSVFVIQGTPGEKLDIRMTFSRMNDLEESAGASSLSVTFVAHHFHGADALSQANRQYLTELHSKRPTNDGMWQITPQIKKTEKKKIFELAEFGGLNSLHDAPFIQPFDAKYGKYGMMFGSASDVWPGTSGEPAIREFMRARGERHNDKSTPAKNETPPPTEVTEEMKQKSRDTKKRAMTQYLFDARRKQRAVRSALKRTTLDSAEGSTNSAKHIRFDADNSEEVKAKGKATSVEDAVESVPSTSAVSSKVLFDSSDSEEEHGAEVFNIDRLGVGQAGEELAHMESTYGGDSRFRLDRRFAEGEQQNAVTDGTMEGETIISDRQRNMQMLGKVVGRAYSPQREGQDTKPRSTRMVRFDPTKPQQQQQQQQQVDSVVNGGEMRPRPDVETRAQKEKRRKREARQASSPLPANHHSTTKAADRSTFMKADFANDLRLKLASSSTPASTAKEQPFSLLAAFGRQECPTTKPNGAINDKKTATAVTTSTSMFQRKLLGFRDSSSEESDGETGDGGNGEVEEKVAEVEKKRSGFFFKKDDPRLRALAADIPPKNGRRKRGRR